MVVVIANATAVNCAQGPNCLIRIFGPLGDRPTDRSLHYHGGYGFSLEYDVQLYYRRARGWSGVIGDHTAQRLRLADLLWGAA